MLGEGWQGVQHECLQADPKSTKFQEVGLEKQAAQGDPNSVAFHLPFRLRPLQMVMAAPRPALGTQLRASVATKKKEPPSFPSWSLPALSSHYSRMYVSSLPLTFCSQDSLDLSVNSSFVSLAFDKVGD